jgi:hypothetical protein
LRNKLDNQNDDITSGIPVVDPYSMDPWMLPGIFGLAPVKPDLLF